VTADTVLRDDVTWRGLRGVGSAAAMLAAGSSKWGFSPVEVRERLPQPKEFCWNFVCNRLHMKWLRSCASPNQVR